MTAILRAALFVAIWACGSVLSAADGAWPSYAPGCYGSLWVEWNVYGRERLPYYALHPPVYYSVPVPRTYGYSPFAYPPGVMTPELLPLEPRVLKNHTIPSKPTGQGKPARVAVAPLRLTNPYVVKSPDPARLGATGVSPVRPPGTGETPVPPDVSF